jgi:hypothetical protein
MSREIRYSRETGYNMGQKYCDTIIYGVKGPRKGKRSLGKPTSAAQEAVNERNAKKTFARIANANFEDDRDIKIDLTFDPQHLPATRKECKKLTDNFLRRVKRAWARHGFETELRYLYVIEGADGKRLHVHMLMTGGLTFAELRTLWGMCEILCVRTLQAGQKGYEALSVYLTKQGKLSDGEHRWYGSRNLVKPDYEERNACVPMSDVDELGDYIANVMDSEKGKVTTAERLAPIESRYPGYFCAEAEAKYIEQFKEWVISIQLYRKDTPAGIEEQKRRRLEEKKLKAMGGTR